MGKAVKRIPDGFHTITPHLVVRGGNRAIEFYRRAFQAEELTTNRTPDGQLVLHSTLRIGNSNLFLNDEFPEHGCRSPQALHGSPVNLQLYVEDVDAVFRRAVEAGAEVLMPPADMFWGDRYGKLKDPFGHVWAIASRVEDLTAAQIQERAAACLAK